MLILVWSRKAIAESSRTRRSCRETEEPVNNWLLPKFGNLYSLQLSRDLQQFLFFIDYGYAHVSLLCFPLVMLFVPNWLLAQAHIRGRTHLPPSPNSTMSIGQGDIPIITLLILSSAGCCCLNIPRYTAPVGMVTFRQSPCWYYPRPDTAVSTSADSQHHWAWWHSGDHSNLINVSVNNILCIHTSRSR